MNDPEYVLEFGSKPDLSMIVNKSHSKSIASKYRMSVGGGTEAGTTRSVKFGTVSSQKRKKQLSQQRFKGLLEEHGGVEQYITKIEDELAKLKDSLNAAQ